MKVFSVVLLGSLVGLAAGQSFYNASMSVPPACQASCGVGVDLLKKCAQSSSQAAIVACVCTGEVFSIGKQCADCSYAANPADYAQVMSYNKLINLCAGAGFQAANASQIDNIPPPPGAAVPSPAFAPTQLPTSGAGRAGSFEIAKVALGSVLATGTAVMLWV